MLGNNSLSKCIPLVTIASCLLAMSPASYSEEQKFSVSIETGIEYDNNITVSTLDTTTGESDTALVFDLSASYLALQNENQELEFTYDFYQSLYDTMDEYDLQIHSLSALGSWIVNDFDIGADYRYSKVYLGRDRLYDSHTVNPSLGFSGMDNLYHRLSYAYVDKNFFNGSTRDGEQNRISVDNYYFFMDNSAYITLGLRYEEENTKDPELDYDAPFVSLGTSIPLPYADIKLKAKYQKYWRDYENVTASIGDKREDEQDLVVITLIKPIYDNVDLKFNYEHNNTDSNLSSIDSVENIYTISLKAIY